MANDIIAPWIFEAWQEALDRLVVDLPVLNLDSDRQLSLLAGASGLMLVTVWLAIVGLPARARFAAGGLAALPLLVFPALFAAVHVERAGLLDGPSGQTAPTTRATTAAAPPADVASPAPIAAAPIAAAPIAAAPIAAAPIAAGPVAAPPVASAPDAVAQGAEPTAQASAPAVAPSVASPIASPDNTPPAPEQPKPAVVAAAPPSQEAPVAEAPHAPARKSSALDYIAGIIAPTPVTPAPKPEVQSERISLPILFATNRAPEGSTFGAVPGPALQLGTGMVTLTPPRAAASGAARLETGGLATASPDEFATAAVRRLVVSRKFPDHALVFVHGFDTTFDAALIRAGQLAYDLDYDGALAVFSWPSAGEPRRYAHDTERAEASAPQLAELLGLLSAHTSARSIGIVALGLGARPVLSALAVLARDRNDAAAKIKDVVLVSPDIDRTDFTARMAALPDTQTGFTLYATTNNRALDITRRFAGSRPRAGDFANGDPLIAPHVLTIDMSLAGTDPLASPVPLYVEQRPLVSHLKAVLTAVATPTADRENTGPRMADIEKAGLEKIETKNGVYWRHPGRILP